MSREWILSIITQAETLAADEDETPPAPPSIIKFIAMPAGLRNRGDLRILVRQEPRVMPEQDHAMLGRTLAFRGVGLVNRRGFAQTRRTELKQRGASRGDLSLIHERKVSGLEIAADAERHHPGRTRMSAGGPSARHIRIRVFPCHLISYNRLFPVSESQPLDRCPDLLE
jgi:hypothetical protein